MIKNKLINNFRELTFLNYEELSKLNKLFDRYVGIINSVLKRHELEKYGIHMFQSTTSNIKILFDAPREPSSGGLGVDFSEKQALFACIGESIERYCMSYIKKNEVISSTISELKDAEPLCNFRFYSDSVYENKYFLDPNVDTLEWVKVINYHTGKNKYVPACLLYIPYDKESVAETTSTGISAHISKELALISGVFEVIERDALMINFLMDLKPPILDLDSITGSLKNFINKISKDYNIRIHKLYTDAGADVYLSFIWQVVNGKYHYGIGACASLDSDLAIMKSLKECLFTFFYSKNIMSLRVGEKDKIFGLYEHFLYYQGNNFSKLLDFGGSKIQYEKRLESDDKIFEILKNKNIPIYYNDITTPDIVKSGYVVVKVFLPNFIDLNKSFIFRRNNNDRFYNVSKKFGVDSNILRSDEPHPFP